MATFTAIKNNTQSRSVLLGVLEYVMQEKNTRYLDRRSQARHFYYT